MNATPLGISAIAVHQPSWELDNSWFGEAMPRKFSHHTGIEARAISLDDEVTMGIAAVRKLQRETGCNLADCRGIVFVSPSFIPASVARQHLDAAGAARERPGRAARQLVRELGLTRCRTIGINWFCCGYSRAMALVSRRWAPRLGLRRDEFVLVVVATRISRITDYSNVQIAGLFGDMASATLLSTPASRRHPVHFEIVHADAEKQPTQKPAFDFHLRDHVPVPAPGGGTRHDDDRLVYSLDGMAIAEIAPRAMSAAVAKALHDDDRLVYSLDGMAIAEIAPRAMSAAVAKALGESGLAGGDVNFVVPHQAGTGIVRFAGMQLEGLGFRGELVNGLTRRTGNVSACSVPHALKETWSRLTGLVACPTAAVGSPGRPEVLQGCVLLRSTALHDRQATVAA